MSNVCLCSLCWPAVVVGKAGRRGEGNIDVALVWFPYDQGEGLADEKGAKAMDAWRTARNAATWHGNIHVALVLFPYDQGE